MHMFIAIACGVVVLRVHYMHAINYGQLVAKQL